jgi:N-methylhydantoinase A
MFIVGVDVGGTFTDVTAADEVTGRVVVTKVPSLPRAEGEAVLAGLTALGIAARDVRRLVHGTTVATNAVLERRGARVALVTTAGFRDLIEIGRTKRNIPALFVPTFVRPKPVVERKHRFEVTERLDADGRVLVPLDAASVERALDGVLDARWLSACCTPTSILATSASSPTQSRAADRAFPSPARPMSCPSIASSSDSPRRCSTPICSR